MHADFHQYLGPDDFHDGRILAVSETLDNGLAVLIQGESGARYVARFTRVTDVVSKSSEGMLLYALAEMTEPDGRRRFVFVNWDEEGENALEVVAQDVNIERE